MSKQPIVIDLETKHTFREFSDPAKLGITVAAVYDYSSDKNYVFTEKEIGLLFPLLENASYVVGYNIDSFDLPVLQPYYPGKIDQIATFDILSDIKKIIGRRLALNDVIKATLQKAKTGHGLQAIGFYQDGKWDELKKYCLDDVLLTKELFDFGIKHGEIYYLDERGRATIKVDWTKYFKSESNNSIPMTLPF